MSGYISINREAFDHEALTRGPFCEHHAWMWLIAEAAWKDCRVRAGWGSFELKRGQCIHSERFIASKFGWTRSKVTRFLAKLTKLKMIRVDADKKASLITVCNYDKYQGRRTTSEPRPNHVRTREEEPNKRIREEKKEREVDAAPSALARPPKSGTKIPLDWQPTEFDIACGHRLGFQDAQIAGMAEDMRLWAEANSNRAVARKANWSLTFQGWMRRDAKKGIAHGNTLQSALQVAFSALSGGEPGRSGPSSPPPLRIVSGGETE